MYSSPFTRGLICLFALVFLAGCTLNPTQHVGKPPACRPRDRRGRTAADLRRLRHSPQTVTRRRRARNCPRPRPPPARRPFPPPSLPRGTVGIDSAQDVPGQAVEQLLQLLNDAGVKSEQVQTDADLRLDCPAVRRREAGLGAHLRPGGSDVLRPGEHHPPGVARRLDRREHVGELCDPLPRRNDRPRSDRRAGDARPEREAPSQRSPGGRRLERPDGVGYRPVRKPQHPAARHPAG